MTSPLDRLNSYLQSKNKTTSLSWEDKNIGPPHKVMWYSTCKLDGVGVGEGSGRTKRRARAAAAENALAALAEPQETDATTS